MTLKLQDRMITQVTPECIQAGVATQVLVRGILFKSSSVVQVVSGGTASATTFVSSNILSVNLTPTATATQIIVRVSTGLHITNQYVINVSPTITQSVVWTKTSDVTFTGNTIDNKTVANGWGNAGPYSTRGIAGCGGYMEFTVKSIVGTQNEMIGLNGNASFDSMWNTIDHAIYLSGTANLANGSVYENGVFGGSLGVCPNGTIIRINIYDNTIQYLKNGVLVLTRPRLSVYPYFVDTSIFNTGISRISNVIISGNLT